MSVPKLYNFLLVDCHNLAYRMWWNLRKMATSAGVATGLEYGFLTGLLNLARRYEGSRMVLVWDGRPTRCLEIFPVTDHPDGTRTGYKAHRKSLADKVNEPDWAPRFARLREALQGAVPTIYGETTEADEEIARLVFLPPVREKYHCLICSRDKDMKQLISGRVHLTMFDNDPETGEYQILDSAAIEAEYGIPPWKLPLYRAIEGDVSDGIDGIPRIPKSVIKALVQESDDLEGLLHQIRFGSHLKTKIQREKLQSEPAEKILRRNYHLMNLHDQSGLQPSWYGKPRHNLDSVLSLCEELEMTSLCDRDKWNLLFPPSGREPEELVF